MNAWDVFTWLMAVTLAGSALVVFVFFMRDANQILRRKQRPGSEEAADSEENLAKRR